MPSEQTSSQLFGYKNTEKQPTIVQGGGETISEYLASMLGRN